MTLRDILLGDDPVGYFRNLPVSEKHGYEHLYALKDSIEDIRWHPEGNSFDHTMLVLEQGKRIVDKAMTPESYTNDILNDVIFQVMLACLVHDFGKALTDPSLMPKHHGHDVRGVKVVREFCQLHNVSKQDTDLVSKTTRYHMYGHKLNELRPATMAKMFRDLDVFKNGIQILGVLFRADARGRLGHENDDLDYLDVYLNRYDDWVMAKINDNPFLQMVR